MATKVSKNLITSVDPSQITTTGATAGQVLTYNNSTAQWVASAAPSPNPSSFYTTVGNASAGIFASAVCFIPSDPGTGTWTAPAGCFTARVTIVGSGANTTYSGNRSHFNYPSGSTTSANQLFANGGNVNGWGGSAGWNGVNNVATGGVGILINSLPYSGGGTGGCGGSGVGGGGGSSTYRGGTAGGGGGSFGVGGETSPINGNGGGGGGGVGGNGHVGGGVATGVTTGGAGGGSPTLSYVAYSLSTLSTVLSSVGRGASGGGGGWCSAIVSVTPGQSYSYSVGAGALYGGGVGIVLIEW